MTAELLQRGYQVTAVDRAELNSRLANHPNLRFIQADVARFNPPRHATYDALLCDMNGPADAAFDQLLRFVPALKPGSPVFFTFKTTGLTGPAEINALETRLLDQARHMGLRLTLRTHLAANRHEFTLAFHVHSPSCLPNSCPPRKE